MFDGGQFRIRWTPLRLRLLGVVAMVAVLTGGLGFAAAPSQASAPVPGSLDTTFNPGTGTFNPGTVTTDPVFTIAVQSDGKILIGGLFATYNGLPRNGITRLNADGTLDTSFLGNGTNDLLRSIAVQPDGKILIGGNFTEYNGTPRIRIARLNADGTLDTSFNPGTGANENIWSIQVQPDGKIVIGGAFTEYNGTLLNKIARLNADGTLDTSFTPGTGANAGVTSDALQSDGKIVISGNFTQYNGTSRNKIARLNTDGTLDTSFNPGTGANQNVYSVAVQPDGKILIGGRFTEFSGTSRIRIARLNTDGTLDTSFNPSAGANQNVYSVAVQPDGKILISGNFTEYDGTSRIRIARLNADGTLDTSFNPGTGAGSDIEWIALQSDGKILIGGDFTEYNGTSRNGIARLNGDPPPPPPPPTTSTTVAPPPPMTSTTVTPPPPTTSTTVTPPPPTTSTTVAPPPPTTSTTMAPNPSTPRFTG